MPTLQDVAKLAGVSTATVSKVLSNTPYFTVETRDKVMQAVDSLGYTPNLAARALSSGKTHIIAVVFPYVYDAMFTDPLVLRILEGVESVCTQRGYNILLSTPRLTATGVEDHYQRILGSGYIEGVIALDSVPQTSVLEAVHQRHIPAVAIGYHKAAYQVISDDFAGGRQLMEHVLELGHTRIGVIGTAEHLHFAIQKRGEGLRAAAEQAGFNFSQFPRLNGDFSTTSGEQAAAQLLAQHPDLTAIICLNDRMAMGAIQAIRALGRRVPRDVTVVGYDDIPMAAGFVPPLTTIDQQAVQLGQNATRILFEVLDGQKPQSVTLPTQLIVRQSSAKPHIP